MRQYSTFFSQLMFAVRAPSGAVAAGKVPSAKALRPQGAAQKRCAERTLISRVGAFVGSGFEAQIIV